MFCPNCKAEYVKGIYECPECHVMLVEEVPSEPESIPEHIALVTVLETTDHTLIMIAKSILDGEGIPHIVQGDTWQDIYGLGGTRLRAHLPPIKIQVAKEDEADARAVLEAIGESESDRNPDNVIS